MDFNSIYTHPMPCPYLDSYLPVTLYKKERNYIL